MKWLSIYIHTDIFVLVSELVVVDILSEWLLIYLSGGCCDHCGGGPGTHLMTYSKHKGSRRIIYFQFLQLDVIFNSNIICNKC